MTKHLGQVIFDESKRLRFLVEKVLQMSMFDRKKAVFKKKKLDLNEMVENISNSFSLRVEHTAEKSTQRLRPSTQHCTSTRFTSRTCSTTSWTTQ